MKRLLCATLITLPALAAAEDPETLTATAVKEVTGFSHPESVASDGTHYFVSNLGKELKPTEKDGDGFISRMKPDGSGLELKFIEGLHAPKGLLVVAGTLYVCDVDRLLGFDLATKAKTVEISLESEGVKFLNDVCAAPKGRLFVSATDKNRVYLVDPKDKSCNALDFDHEPKSPNGLSFLEIEEEDDQKVPALGVVEWGTDDKPNGTLRGYKLDPTLLKATEEDPGGNSPVKPGYLDGLVTVYKQDKPFGLLYTDWVAFKPEGRLFFFGEPGEFEVKIPDSSLGGPADLFFDAKADRVALPCMLDHRVLLFSVPFPKDDESAEESKDGDEPK